MDRLTLLALFLNVLLFSNSIDLVHGVNIALCTQTPFPDLCNSLESSTKTHATLGEDRDIIFGIRESALRMTLAHAQNAHKLILAMNLSSFGELGKAAWADCVEVYEDTIHKLNKTISPNQQITMSDVQTWLSAAIANYETCQNGFLDFKLAHQFESFPPMLSDFSMYLRNSLSINKAIILSSSPSSSTSSFTNPKNVRHRRGLLRHDFPEWLSRADRRLLQKERLLPKADLTVAQDGSGNCRTVSAAVAAASRMSNDTKRFVVYVKRGVYKENVEISRSMQNLMLIGDGIDATIITSDKSIGGGVTTFRSATFGVSGDGFIARDITFENTAGPQQHQAVAMRSGADFSVFYRCSFKGYQDTLYVYSQRQFYRQCDIYGTVDSVFGDAAAVLQNCNIYLRKPMDQQKNTIAASGRTDLCENTGIIFQNSRVTTFSNLTSVKSYMGRPWKRYATTVYIKCYLDTIIDPQGWLEWSGDFALSTLYYGEYLNIGPGANTSGRVKWPGYHVIGSPMEAGEFTVGEFLNGDLWIPASGVPFTSGM